MVRKSERNKSQAAAAAPEKTTSERGRKSTRTPRRRKKSSSESEGEGDAHVEKEVGEISQAPVEVDSAESARTRRSARRQAHTEKPPENDKPSEWKEDPTFWGTEEAPAPEGPPGPEGTTWKIESSNGSGGEIQKLKICRQRVSESADSSSPGPVKESSPRRKKGTKSSKNVDESSESNPDVSNQSESKEDSRTESVDMINNQSETEGESKEDANANPSPPLEEITDKEEVCKVQKETDTKEEGSLPKEIENISNEENSENSKGDGKNLKNEEDKLKHEDSKPQDDKNESKDNEEKISDEKNASKVESEIQDTGKTVEEGGSKNKLSGEEEKIILNSESEKIKEDNDKETKGLVEIEDKKETEGSKVEEKNETDLKEVKASEVVHESSPTHNKECIVDIPTPEANISKTPVEPECSQATPSTDTKEEKKDSESNNNSVEMRVRTKSETSDDGKGDKKVPSGGVSKVKVAVNSEDAMDEIAKKLNERAARFGKDPVDIKENKRLSSESVPEPQSPREEGELTPVPEQKKKHSTIIINRPKEIVSQPTRLKRNTDELPPIERKRRLMLKARSKEKHEEDPINISSQSLMLLVPEVKTITPEQVAAFPLDDDLIKFEEEQVAEVKIKKKIDLKPKDVLVRVENDAREVIKKKPIVIDRKDTMESKPVGPKLPNQDNHRVVRKISLVTEDVKKLRRSPSPGGKCPTEVLFITNLVRPFTIPQLRELLARTGTIAQNGFYIDKIKSKCYVKYTDVEMAIETRHALNGVRWPVNNPKTLRVEFASAEDMSIVQKLADEETVTKKTESADHVGVGWLSEQAALKPQRRVTTAVREWDMGKIGLIEEKKTEEWRGKQEPLEQKRRPQSPTDAKFEPPPRKVKKRDNDAPAKLLDDLFRKTKATPCIYWLPLTAAQIAVKEEMRRQHILAENERRLAELRKNDHSRREKERDKSRDRRKK